METDESRAFHRYKRLGNSTAVSSQRVTPKNRELLPAASNKNDYDQNHGDQSTANTNGFQKHQEGRGMRVKLRHDKLIRPMTVQNVRRDMPQSTFAQDKINSRPNDAKSINVRNFVIMDKQNYKDYLRDKKNQSDRKDEEKPSHPISTSSLNYSNERVVSTKVNPFIQMGINTVSDSYKGSNFHADQKNDEI